MQVSGTADSGMKMTINQKQANINNISFQIKDIVAKSAYDMYETQLLQTTLESMADVDFCPRLNCQCATIVDREMNMGQV